ncbi:DMT family transporter [Serratia proteamaculans]|uniref:DMT family transporter n=1 Tax=Serratia proteamaculans TaxID=28151 RepID=UPI0039B10D1B
MCGSATGKGSFPGHLLLTHEYDILTKELAYCHNWLFVFLWSTGFVAAKFTVQFSGPFHLLFLRGAFSCLIFLLLALAFRSRFPSRAGIVRNLIVGLFLQSFFLGECFYAIHRGMPAGIVALITGPQPVLTAKLVSVLQRKHLRPRKWFGIAVGFTGVYLVLSPGQHSFSLDPAAFGSVIIGVLGVTIGALYQRRAQGEGHIFANTFLQYVTLTVSMGLIGLLFESTSTQ